jgi:membrane protein
VVNESADNFLGFGLVTLAILLYGASRMYTGLDRTLAVVFRTNRHSYMEQKLHALAIAPLLAGTLLASTLIASVTTAIFDSSIGQYFDIDASIQERFVAYGIAVSILVVMLSIAYDRIPERRPGLRHVLVGAVPAAFAVVALSQIFPIYIRITGGYSIYGSLLGFSLVFMLWLYLLGQIFVIGAEIIALRAGLRDGDDDRPA